MYELDVDGRSPGDVLTKAQAVSEIVDKVAALKPETIGTLHGGMCEFRVKASACGGFHRRDGETQQPVGDVIAKGVILSNIAQSLMECSASYIATTYKTHCGTAIASMQDGNFEVIDEDDHVASALRDAESAPRIQWPAGKDAGRAEDMGAGYLRVVLDSDNDVCVEVFDGEKFAGVEFCNPGGGGGGRSSRTRMALIALMVAMEADNAENGALQRPA